MSERGWIPTAGYQPKKPTRPPPRLIREQGGLGMALFVVLGIGAVVFAVMQCSLDRSRERAARARAVRQGRCWICGCVDEEVTP